MRTYENMIAGCLYIGTLFSGITAFAQTPEAVPADVMEFANGSADAPTTPTATNADVGDHADTTDSVDRIFSEAALRLAGVAKSHPEQVAKLEADLKWAAEVIQSYMHKGTNDGTTDWFDGTANHLSQPVPSTETDETRTTPTERHLNVEKTDDAGTVRVVFDRPGAITGSACVAAQSFSPGEDVLGHPRSKTIVPAESQADLLRKTAKRLHELSKEIERMAQQLAEPVRPVRPPSSADHVAGMSSGTGSKE